MTRTALYRFFDAEAVLLYVGITENVEIRWGNHAGQKRWWPDVARKTVDWHDDRESAEAAERRAIVDEKPIYNVAHSTNPRPKRADAEPPAARYHARVVAELAAQGRTDQWLQHQAKVEQGDIDSWRTRPLAPQAWGVMKVADALGIDREEAAELSGLEVGVWTDLTIEEIQARGVSDIELLMELSKRILRTKDEVEVAIMFMRQARR